MGLRSYVLKRSIYTVVLLFFVITLNFLIFRVMPGTQAAIAGLVGTSKVPQELLEQLAKSYGIGEPLWDQYRKYIVNMLTFNWGFSFSTGQPVYDEMIGSGRFVNTLVLLGTSTTIALLIGTLLGVLVAARRGGLFDNFWVTTSLTTFSLPTFWMGIMFLSVFYTTLGWFPRSGTIPSAWEQFGKPPFLEELFVRLQYLFLPALTLTLFFYGGNLLITRSTMLETLSEDYVTTARAKGLNQRVILFKHALRNASLPLVTNAALQYGFILSGAIITETVFGWKGLGTWIFDSVGGKDFPVMQALFFIIGLMVIIANFASDLIYGVLDPRIKYD